MTDLSASIKMVSVQDLANYFDVDVSIISKAINDKCRNYQDVYNFIQREKGKQKMTDHISNNIRSLKVEQITELNNYHNAPEKEPKYAAVRDACSELMKVIIENCPECADRTTALNNVRLARMWAARCGLP